MDRKNQKKNYGGIQESPFNKGAGTRSVTGGSLKDNNGITLIALVITIIVMLILVAVTITMAVNGGLFEYAQKAVDETKNAINAEQQLANGKIKIGGKWYASIDDYINNNPIKSGIEITPTEVTLKKKEAEDVEGEEKLTETITANVYGMDTEPEITWEITPEDQTAITLSGATGKTVTITAVGTENATVKLTAKCTYEGEEYEETIDVNLEIIKKPVEVAKGDFVEYGVAYTDVYISKDYTTTNGWRLLNYEIDEDGNLYGVELISTGVPAQLFYYGTSYNSEGNNKWWIADSNKITAFQTTLQNYYGEGTGRYTFYSNTGSNVYAAAGMHDNFENIPFYTETNYSSLSGSSQYNVGYYRSIEKNGEAVITDKSGSDLFLTSDDYSVRMLTLPEINNDRSDVDGMTLSSTEWISSAHEPAAGLYVLLNMKNISGLSSNIYNIGSYWLASPVLDEGYRVFYVFFTR